MPLQKINIEIHSHATFPQRVPKSSFPLPSSFRSYTSASPSLSVDRTSTKHTVFAMIQFDSASDSKVSLSPADPDSPRPSRTSTAKKCCTTVFKSKKRTQSSLHDGLDADEARKDDKEAPMRVVSPRATDVEPVPSTTKRRTFSFKKRHSHKSSPTSPARQFHTSIHPPTSGGHVPVTDVSYQSPARRQSVAMGRIELPTSPTREAALTSHPINMTNGRREDDDDKFETPMEYT